MKTARLDFEQGDYGDPTIAAFNMTLGTKQPDVNFGGRVVYETNPQGATGSDSCWFAQAPFPKATSLAQFDSWNVQNDNISGSYGPDYIGLDGNEVSIKTLRACFRQATAQFSIQCRW